MMSNPVRVVVDTNILFMSIYGSDKAEKILQLGAENKIELFAPISVKEELEKVLEREFDWSEKKIEDRIDALSVNWIEKEVYQDALETTTVKHKADKPIEALASVLNCEILTADKHFDNVKNKINVDDLLAKLN